MLWQQKVLEIQEAIVAHTDEVGIEELSEAVQPVPVPIAAVGSELV